MIWTQKAVIGSCSKNIGTTIFGIPRHSAVVQGNWKFWQLQTNSLGQTEESITSLPRLSIFIWQPMFHTSEKLSYITMEFSWSSLEFWADCPFLRRLLYFSANLLVLSSMLISSRSLCGTWVIIQRSTRKQIQMHFSCAIYLRTRLLYFASDISRHVRWNICGHSHHVFPSESKWLKCICLGIEGLKLYWSMYKKIFFSPFWKHLF